MCSPEKKEEKGRNLRFLRNFEKFLELTTSNTLQRQILINLLLLTYFGELLLNLNYIINMFLAKFH
jgi:hypothetical protein